jgi:hypothetical protein
VPAGSREFARSPAIAVLAIVWLASTPIINDLVSPNALRPIAARREIAFNSITPNR